MKRLGLSVQQARPDSPFLFNTMINISIFTISEKYKPMNHNEQQAESSFAFYKVVITVSFFRWIAVIFGDFVEVKM